MSVQPHQSGEPTQFSPSSAPATATPRGMRLVITLAGRTNVGKSALLNALAGQSVSIVSDTPGTTTDAVAKAYELPPFGPVTFYDTAGLDDTGDLGAQRMAATRKVLFRSDMVLLVTDEHGLLSPDMALLAELQAMDMPVVVVRNKADIPTETGNNQTSIPVVSVSARTGHGLDVLRDAMSRLAPASLRDEPVLVADLISEGDTVLCVVPIDLAAPKGRLILPQVQVLRDILDSDALGMVVKERELEAALDGLRTPPALVVTDSQVVLKVAGDVPDDVPLTTFSTLFARFKGDLPTMVRGARAIDSLQDGDRVLLCEACSHHAVADDIGRVKIPRWLTQYTGKSLHCELFSGHDFPERLEDYALVIHCGGCMTNRAEMLRRMRECTRRGVPVTNYGVAISKLQGLLERVVAPFGL